MEAAEFNELLNECIEQDKKLGETKGADYTIGNSDRLNNFKTVGELVCCPHCQKPVGPRAVWAVYVMKHILALLAWAKTGKVESEGLKSRAFDVRLYMPLGLGIAKEQERQESILEYGRTVSLERREGPADRRIKYDFEYHCSLKGGGRRFSFPSWGRRSTDIRPDGYGEV